LSDFAIRVRCLRLAIQRHAMIRMELEHLYADFLGFVKDSEPRMEALEMSPGGSKLAPMLQHAENLAMLLEPPRASAPAVSKASPATRRSRGPRRSQ
jgi:hypothetical protein